MSYNFGFDRPDDRLLKIIEERDEQIQKLRDQLNGKDKEKDTEICDMIRNIILQQPMPDAIEHLTAALVNMRKVMMSDELMKKMME